MKLKRKIPLGKGILAAASLSAALGLGAAVTSWQPAAPAASTPAASYTRQAEETEYGVLLYMVGSNLESECGAATANLQELLAADLGTVRVVGEAGGSLLWHTEGFEAGKNTRFRIEEGRLTVDAALPARNMGEAGTLADFIQYARTCYPAEKTVLVLWDHGDGPVGGFGCDDLCGGDSLMLTELDAALAAAGCDRQPLEVIGLDACCMATLETALTFSPYARYMVASQEMEPAGGWDYTAMASLPGTGPKEAALLLAQQYYAKNAASYPAATVSVTDLAALEGLAQQVETLAAGLEQAPLAGQAQARAGVFGFGGAGRAQGQSDLVDLRSLVEALAPLAEGGAAEEDPAGSGPGEPQGLETALRQAVLLSLSEGGQACGLSLYAPYAELDDAANQLQRYRAVGKLPRYEAGAQAFAEYLQSARLARFEPLSVQAEGGLLQVEGPPGVRTAYATLWEQDETADGYYYLVGTDGDLTEENGEYSCPLNGEWTFLGGQPLCTLELQSPEGLYTQYACPVLYEGRRANLILQYDLQNPYGRAAYLVPLGETGFSRQVLPLQGGEELTPLYPVEAFADAETGGEAPPPAPADYPTAVPGFKVGEPFVYEDGMAPEALPAAEAALYGFWFVTWENQDVYSEFYAAA